MILVRGIVLSPFLIMPLLGAAEIKPPAEYERIDIIYTLASGPKLTENLTGLIRLNDTPALPALKGVLVPLLNVAGRADLRDLRIVHADGNTIVIPPDNARRTSKSLFWEVPEACAGDEIRFSVEQPVDLEGEPPKVWWFNETTLIPFLVKKGSIELTVPEGFAGSVAVLNEKNHSSTSTGHSWQIDGEAVSAGSEHFIISSFRKQEDLAKWIAGACPTDAGENVKQLVKSLDNSTADPGDRSRALSEALSTKLKVRSSAKAIVLGKCRTPEAVLNSTNATPLEAQALLYSMFHSAGLKAERALSTVFPASNAVNPHAFTTAWVRVKNGDGWLWFDASRLVGASGTPPSSMSAQRALLLETGVWTDLVDRQTASASRGQVSARVDASILNSGTLQVSLKLTSTGFPSQPYRESLQSDGAHPQRSKLLSSFIEERRLRSSPHVSDPYGLKGLFELKLTSRDDRFVLPIRRQASIELNAIPLLQDPQPLPNNFWWIGAVGTYSEEIKMDAPAYAVTVDSHLKEERKFARFRSDAVVEDGKLYIKRELEITSAVIGGTEKPDLESLRKVINNDQQCSFLLRRINRKGIQEWVDSVETYEANHLGYEALEQREFDAARQLLERAIQGDPKDEYAWNNLGRALYSLGRLDEARKAYEKQIEINPKDIYSYNNLGLLDLKQGRWVQARDHFKKQLEVNPGDVYATQNLPRTLAMLGQWADAEVAWARAAAQAGSKNSMNRVEEVAAKACQGKVADLSGEIGPLLGVPPFPPLLNNVAYDLAECGQELKLAEKYATQAVEYVETLLVRGDEKLGPVFTIQHMLGNHLDTQGWVAWKRGEVERAARLLGAAVLLCPNGVTFSHLATVQAKLGQAEDAADSWGDAISLMPGLLSEVSQTMQAQIKNKPSRVVDGVWYPLQAAGVSTQIEKPAYFVAFANPDGTVKKVRPLDLTDPVDQGLVPLVQKLLFPQVSSEHGRIPTVHVIKILRDASGETRVYRSTSDSAVAIVADLVPDEFPTASPSTQPKKKE